MEIIWGKNLEELHSMYDNFYYQTWQNTAGDVELQHAVTLALLSDPVERHYAVLKHPEWVRW